MLMAFGELSGGEERDWVRLGEMSGCCGVRAKFLRVGECLVEESTRNPIVFPNSIVTIIQFLTIESLMGGFEVALSVLAPIGLTS